MAQTRIIPGLVKERQMNELQRTLTQMLAVSGKSLNQVASLGQLDRAYLMRLLDGTKTNPSLETLMRLWIGLCFDARIVEREPAMIHGLAALLQSAAMSRAPLKLSEER